MHFLRHINYIDDNNKSISCVRPDIEGSDDSDRSVFEWLVTFPDEAPLYQPACREFVLNTYRELWFMEINAFFKKIEILVTIAFTLEVLLYWLDDFGRYWKNITRMFDFVITLFCVLQLMTDRYMANHTINSLDSFKKDICPTVTFKSSDGSYDGTTYNLTGACETPHDPDISATLLYILNQRQNQTLPEQEFLGTPLRRFCNNVRSGGQNNFTC